MPDVLMGASGMSQSNCMHDSAKGDVTPFQVASTVTLEQMQSVITRRVSQSFTHYSTGIG